MQEKYPRLQVSHSDADEIKATREFMLEWKGELEQDSDELSDTETYKNQNHTKMISGIIAEGLGPLGKYTRGGQAGQQSNI